MTTLFPTHRQFQLACLAFIEQHQSTDNEAGTYPEECHASQSGWKWQNHPVHSHNGYMSRRDLKAVRSYNLSTDAVAFNEMEEEEDVSVAHLSTGRSPSYVEVEWNVVYSKTYRIPQLCFNVSDSTGSPLSLSELIATGIIFHRSPNPTQIHDEHLDLSPNRNDDSSDMHNPFPLLQRIHHPYAFDETASNFAQTVWSIHPCHVQDTIAEILAPNPANESSSSRNAGPSSKAAQNIAEISIVGFDEQASQVQAQVRWLDCWFMVTSTLLNLRP